MTKLDYSIESPQDRTTFVSNLLSTADPATLTSQYLETLADYLIIASEKQERKDSRKRELLTANRTTTITKYETSLKVSLRVLRMEKMVFITLPLTETLSSHQKFQSRRKTSQTFLSCGSSEIRSSPGKPLSVRQLDVMLLSSRKP